MTQPIQAEQVNDLLKAVRRLAELRDASIVTKDSETEKQALSRHVAERMAAHAEEFLATWMMVQFEYIPVCRALDVVMRRLSTRAPVPEKPAGEPAQP